MLISNISTLMLTKGGVEGTSGTLIGNGAIYATGWVMRQCLGIGIAPVNGISKTGSIARPACANRASQLVATQVIFMFFL